MSLDTMALQRQHETLEALTKELAFSYDDVIDLLSELSDQHHTASRRCIELIFCRQHIEKGWRDSTADSRSMELTQPLSREQLYEDEAPLQAFKAGEYTYVTPDETDVAARDAMMADFETDAATVSENWHSRDLLRFMLLTNDDGDEIWVYNAKAVVSLVDTEAWKIIEINGERYWIPEVEVVPLTDEYGELVGYEPGEIPIVLPTPDELVRSRSQLSSEHYSQAELCRQHMFAIFDAAPKGQPIAVVPETEYRPGIVPVPAAPTLYS